MKGNTKETKADYKKLLQLTKNNPKYKKLQEWILETFPDLKEYETQTPK